ncbi:MAG: right-handed parallel beta-helix repeat-containing protein [Candidatus Coatesbacteria bacterium]|nr:right-handed parallel beta-helix repeat-containing protein [Candidatus Coatesbacteria bacterium]
MRSATLFTVLTSSMFLATTAAAEPTVAIYTDASEYASGETIEVSLSGTNFGDGVAVAVWVGLLTAEGSICTLGPDGWNDSFQPWIDDIYLPSGLDMDETAFWRIRVPCLMPPIKNLGDYDFAAVLTRPGTTDWVSELSLARFRVSFHGGEVTEDLTLSGEIVLRSDAIVRDGVILTIQPGSRVRLAKSVGIRVYGGLVAEGEAEDPIVFERLNPNERWQNISFWQSAMVDYCRVVNCEISGAAGTDCGHYWGVCGGGIFCHVSVTISGSTFIGNYARWGGAICCYMCSAAVTNNTIVGNSALYAGGIFCYAGSPMISGNSISGNSTTNWGGGICCRESSPTITGNVINDNLAYYGGGVHCYHSSPTISCNLIAGNYGEEDGGGIFNRQKSSPVITNNTISYNWSEYGADGIACMYESHPIITDCIIWGSGDDLSDCSATYCCIEDPDEGEGNIHSDPMFVTGPLGDYYLHPDSPCVDAGSRSAEEAAMSNLTTQADGTPDTGTVDMGCHYPLP